MHSRFDSICQAHACLGHLPEFLPATRSLDGRDREDVLAALGQVKSLIRMQAIAGAICRYNLPDEEALSLVSDRLRVEESP